MRPVFFAAWLRYWLGFIQRLLLPRVWSLQPRCFWFRKWPARLSIAESSFQAWFPWISAQLFPNEKLSSWLQCHKDTFRFCTWCNALLWIFQEGAHHTFYRPEWKRWCFMSYLKLTRNSFGQFDWSSSIIPHEVTVNIIAITAARALRPLIIWRLLCFISFSFCFVKYVRVYINNVYSIY